MDKEYQRILNERERLTKINTFLRDTLDKLHSKIWAFFADRLKRHEQKYAAKLAAKQGYTVGQTYQMPHYEYDDDDNETLIEGVFDLYIILDFMPRGADIFEIRGRWVRHDGGSHYGWTTPEFLKHKYLV